MARVTRVELNSYWASHARRCVAQDAGLPHPRIAFAHRAKDRVKSMTDKLIWILSPAIFAIIGLVAGYLNSPNYTVLFTIGGCVVGFAVAAFALAGEKPKP